MRDSLFLHLYNSALRTNGVDQYLLPPAGSLLRQLVELHSVEGWTGKYDEYGVPKNNPMFVEARCRVEAERRMALRTCAHMYLRSGRDKDYKRMREYAWDIWRLIPHLHLGSRIMLRMVFPILLWPRAGELLLKAARSYRRFIRL
jgi:hypothetical protein